MLTFLRKIRESLIESGSARKYMLYAIGEIALVVIGILIALQINNWNEWRKERKLERSTLIEISFDLIKDTTRISSDITRMQHSRYLIRSVIEHVEARKPIDSTFSRSVILSYTAHSPTFAKFNSSAFDLLKERGTDIITNTALRSKIVQHYTGAHMDIDGWLANLRDVWTLQADRLYDNFRIIVDSDNTLRMHPNIYNDLLKNPQLMNPFYHFEALVLNSIINLKELQRKTVNILQYIEEEIGETE